MKTEVRKNDEAFYTPPKQLLTPEVYCHFQPLSRLNIQNKTTFLIVLSLQGKVIFKLLNLEQTGDKLCQFH